MTKEDLVLEGAHAVMRITKREVDWNTAVRLSRCIMAMQDVSAVKESLTVPDGWQLVPTEDMSKAELIDLIEQQQQELEAIGAGGVSGKR